MTLQENIKTANANFPGDEPKSISVGHHFKTLIRRYVYLQKKLQAKQYSQSSEAYIRAEIATLRWVMQFIIEKYPHLKIKEEAK